VAIDSVTISRTADSTFIVRTRIQFPQLVALPTGENVDREIDTEEVHCPGARSRPMLSELYSGDALVKMQPQPKEWAPVTPGRRAVFDASCAWLTSGFAARLPRSYDLSEVERQPELDNRPIVAAALGREYPRALRDAGQTGTVTLRFRVLPDGTVDRASVTVENATHPDFAEAARRVVYVMHFRPARIRKGPVPVWVTLPVTFQLAYPAPYRRQPDGFPPLPTPSPFPPPARPTPPHPE
jgi:TonB family protein